MANFTNATKNTAVKSNKNKYGISTWNDKSVAWDDALFSWDSKTAEITNATKNTALFTNKNKN